MAKKSKNKEANLILMVLSLALPAVSWVGLACNFINQKTTLLGNSVTAEWNLSNWFENIETFASVDGITNWQVACYLLIATAILLIVMTVLMLAKFFIKHPFLKWSTLITGIAVVVCAVIFMITTFAGCGVLSTDVVLGSSVQYIANFGVYMVGIGAILSAICAEAVVFRK